MESIYYVISWACPRTCAHCYEERFRPYSKDELEQQLSAIEAAFPRIVEHLPQSMLYRDWLHPEEDGSWPRKKGRIILGGGEVLLEPVRRRVLYPVLELLQAKYAETGGALLVVQTAGDLLTDRVLDKLLERGAHMVSISSMDDFHAGMEGERKERLRERLTELFLSRGMAPAEGNPWEQAGPVFGFFGATPESWIGKLWPRGRAWRNGLSQATMADNFCNAWSGGLGFLDYGLAGSEVAVDPDGKLFPCCLKTQAPYGDLTKESLKDILRRLAGHPAFEAVSMGHPERMGLAQGWSVERFLSECRTVDPTDRAFHNLCIGCDAFHRAHMAGILRDLDKERP